VAVDEGKVARYHAEYRKHGEFPTYVGKAHVAGMKNEGALAAVAAGRREKKITPAALEFFAMICWSLGKEIIGISHQYYRYYQLDRSVLQSNLSS
jgi:hypothetical protein